MHKHIPDGANSILNFKGVITLILISAIAPTTLLLAPAIASQLVLQWQLSPTQISKIFFIELSAAGLATLPAYYWQPRFSWHKVGYLTIGIYFLANILSAFMPNYEALLVIRCIAAFAVGTLLVLCMSSAAASPNKDRIYGLWLAGQLILAAIGLWVLPYFFKIFGLKALYISVAILMFACIPLIRYLPNHFVLPKKVITEPLSPEKRIYKPFRKIILASISLFLFYLSIGMVWPFMSFIGHDANIDNDTVNRVFSIASLAGIAGAVLASFVNNRILRYVLIIVGFSTMLISVFLLFGKPYILLFTISALIFKFNWTFIVPFLLAVLAENDSTGHMMNSANLLLCAGLAIGPIIGANLLESFYEIPGLLTLSSIFIALSMGFILIASKPSRVAN